MKYNWTDGDDGAVWGFGDCPLRIKVERVKPRDGWEYRILDETYDEVWWSGTTYESPKTARDKAVEWVETHYSRERYDRWMLRLDVWPTPLESDQDPNARDYVKSMHHELDLNSKEINQLRHDIDDLRAQSDENEQQAVQIREKQKQAGDRLSEILQNLEYA